MKVKPDKTKVITLPCDCKCCMFVIQKTVRKEGDVNYNISIQDSRYDHNHNTFQGRIKRAINILFGKPIYYNDVFLDGNEAFNKLVSDINELAKSNLEEDDVQ